MFISTTRGFGNMDDIEKKFLNDIVDNEHWDDTILYYTNRYGRPLAHLYASKFVPPLTNFPWELSYKHGWSAAHEAARHGNLPKGFYKWYIRDNYSTSVAHTFAIFNKLPIDFPMLTILDKEKETPGHKAARFGNLPKDFKTIYKNLWKQHNIYGDTIEDLYHRYKKSTKEKKYGV